MSIQETFAANMKKYRKRCNLTQEQLAEKSGLHRTYIGGIEQKRVNVSLKNVGKIAAALDVDPALLFMHERTCECAETKESAEPETSQEATPSEAPSSKTPSLEMSASETIEARCAAAPAAPQQPSKASTTMPKSAQRQRAQAFTKHGYGLCTWTDDGIEVFPINVDNEQLTISILCALINDGHGDDLAEAYESTQTQLLAYFRSRNFLLS